MQFWQEALTVKRPEKTNQLAQRYCESSNNYFTYPRDSVCTNSRCQIQAKCGHVDVPNEYSSECSEKHNGRLHRLYTNGSGIPSAGYVVLFDGYQTRSCNGSVAAHAGSCLMDLDTDRPILGYVNVCPGKLKIKYPQNRYSLGIFIHEIAHALGFSSSSFAFMRFSNGTERTPRDHWHKPIHRDKQGYYIPSDNTMIKIKREWESAEGMFTKEFYSFITPAVLGAAKKHLKCSSLDGVDIENQKHRGPIGSHWEGKTYGEKTTNVTADPAAIGLNIHKGKSKVLQYNTACTNPITIDGEGLEDVKTFTYPGSIIDEQGGSDADVKARIDKARAAYLQLKNIWNSKQLSTNTKLRIFNAKVRTVLLYGAETWRTTKAII
ncbi:unnamed protein product [Schistosoma margrebowiei]|uniref:Leishmanolysin-like peptidase n=1 Tax=Schistosoma margrebowiei TaxID=48269 RepID=A0A183MEL9_9TREM|nr:unnamed protein product [Schistosoma margrebowiei]